jgi:hypothetical protein
MNKMSEAYLDITERRPRLYRLNIICILEVAWAVLLLK